MSDAAANDAASVERLWLDTLHALGRPVAHEVKNALNGVAVNLEVVRTRAARPGAPAESVARFADAAAGQVEALTTLLDALLALVRPVGDGPDAAAVVGKLAVLLDAVARPDGGAVEFRVLPEGEPVRTGLDGATLRTLAGALLLAAADQGRTLSCELDGGSRPALRVRRPGAALPPPPPAVRALAERAGVRLDTQGDAWVAELPSAVPAAIPASR